MAGAVDIVDFDHDPSDALRDRIRGLLVVDADGPDTGVPVTFGLAQICRAATSELALQGVVVTLWAAAGSQAVVGASDATSRVLEELQFGVGEGPGLDAFRAGQPVLVPDLGAALYRWPGYVPEAVRAGVGAVFTFPLQLGAVRFGVLTAYADRERELTSQETAQGLVFAELATEFLLESSEAVSTGPDGANLYDGLYLPYEIYQAQGVVKVQLGITLLDSLARMRAHAFATSQNLNAVAGGILDGTIHIPQDD